MTGAPSFEGALFCTFKKGAIKMFSRFLRVSEKNGIVAVFHALKPDPVFLGLSDWNRFKNGDKLSRLTKILVKKGIIVFDSNKDDECINKIRTEIENVKMMSILYLVLTKGCNFCCRQCFQLERHSSRKYPLLMTKETALDGIKLFVKHIEQSTPTLETQIYFYGGEPLLNWKTFSFSVEQIEKFVQLKTLPEDTQKIVITNGSLINHNVIRYFSEHNISVGLSVDGRKEENDLYRRTIDGKDTFAQIMHALNLLQKYQVHTSLSITVTPTIVTKLSEIVEWAHGLGVSFLCFNPIGGKSYNYVEDILAREEYEKLLANSLMEAFKTARKLGMLEDRVGRKVSDFVDGIFTVCDCGAVGNQLVIHPDGGVGFCHASRAHDIGSVMDEGLSVFGHSKIENWKNALPVFNKLCKDCPAISVCGYGCFHNVVELGNDVSARDKPFCAYAKKVINFLIWDLYEKI